MLKLAVLVSGGGTNLQAILDAIDSGKIKNAEVALVIANKTSAYALERAKNHGIKTAVIRKKDFASKEDAEQAMIDAINAEGCGLVVLAGFLSVLSPKFIRAFEKKIINIHPSLIPSFCGEGYYGLKVHEEALKKGVKVTGATVHYVDEIVDGGEILAQKAVYVEDGDTPEVLQKRVMTEAEWIILPEVSNKLANQ